MLKNPELHQFWLLKILKAVYSDPTLGPVLGFKGGTAAMFFYDLDRLSVDLDFDLLDPSREGEVFEKMKNILKEFGQVREQYQKHHTLFFMLSYADETHNIKIEISRRGSEARYGLRSHLGIPMLVMEREDMAAYKLIALLERKKTAHRDFYDAWFFLSKLWDINKTIIEAHSKMSFKNYLKKAIAFVEQYPDRYILQGIGDLLDEKQKAWAKTHLKKDLLFELKLRLG